MAIMEYTAYRDHKTGTWRCDCKLSRVYHHTCSHIIAAIRAEQPQPGTPEYAAMVRQDRRDLGYGS